jgi:hypothetical protein
MSASNRFALVTCEVFYREMCWAISRSPNQVDMVALPKGLHDLGSDRMRSRVQEAIDGVKASDYDAILMGYGLCNNGLAGIVARHIPIVLPRAHDCITLFMGSRERYIAYFNDHPGTYFKTTGWIERGSAGEDLKQLSIQQQHGMNMSYEEMVEKYGEDNAQYLYDELCNHTRNYGQFTFIEMGVEPDASFERLVEKDAEKRGWAYQKIQGDLSLIRKLIDGLWDESEFLVVAPGEQIAPTYDLDRIVQVEPAIES